MDSAKIERTIEFSMHAGRREKSLALELQHVSGPIYHELGIRSQFVIHNGMGHAMVPPATVEQAFRWLEEGLAKRREMAESFPTTRITGNPSRQEWATAWLNEAKKRLETPEQIVAGLEQLDSIAKRWPDLAEGKEAKAVFDDYQSRDPRPWVAEAKQARLGVTERLAKRYEQLAMGNIGASSVRRSGFARGALMNWNIILQDSDDAEQIDRAKENIDVLQKIEKNDPTARKEVGAIE